MYLRTIMTEQTPYVVSARKYRPATFKSVVGQRALTSTLKNAITTNRIAQAYLFCGPRGVGKTSCARIFAKTINCLSPTADGEACGVCESCRAIDKGNSFNLVELDAASNNSVDDIRSITEQVYVPAQNGRYRIFIIDEVHMLSNAAFNAFLKTLEEPPRNVVFILATTEKHKVIPTILSRCQIYDFKRITINDMIDHLAYVAQEEGVTADREALGVIALKADGAMRDALSIFDQVAASSQGNITYSATIDNLNVLDYDYYFRLIDAFRKGDVPAALLIYKEIRDKGFDSLFMINGLATHVRNLMVAVDPRTIPLLETSNEVAKKFEEQSHNLPIQWYYAAMKLLTDCDFQYRTATGKRLLVEVTLIRLCQLLKPATPPFDMLDRPQPLGDPTVERRAANPVSSQSPTPPAPPRPTAQPAGQTASTTEAPAAISHKPAPTAPVTPEQTTATRPTQRSRRLSSFRLSESVTTPAETATYTSGTKNDPFTYEQFMQVWNSFINQNPSLHILINAMRGAKPLTASPNEYKIIVDHPAQFQAFEMHMGRLLEFMRRSLGNDLLTLHVEVDTTPVENKNLPPKEFLNQVVTANPALADFLKKVDAEFA